MPRCGLLDFFLLDSGDREAFRCEDLLGDFDTGLFFSWCLSGLGSFG